ncbi:MAG: AmmeMemoRadiSam system protein B [Myxococcales bacterium]|nr:AmmeMemoRadiSam system protein B [Myxococcales bacterium]
MRIREPAVAGVFYPSDPLELRATVRRYLDEARGEAPSTPVALIAPHAGYVYSGPIAGSAYASVAALRGKIARVVLLGPAHRVAFAGLAIPDVDALRTPLGLVRLDGAARDRVRTLPFVLVDDRPHAHEHALEVQLPFVQEVLGDVPVLPIVVGRATPEQVAQVLEMLWDPSTLVIVSSDLSHYLPKNDAHRLDGQTRDAIEALAPERFEDNSACGRLPIAGLLALAKRRGLGVTTLDLRTSGDTAGTGEEVVGYGAFALTRQASREVRLPDPQEEDDELLLELARLSVAHAATHGRALPVTMDRLPPSLRAPGASFVTLRVHANHALRGCLGTLEASRPLALDVVENAAAAALRDPRFAPVGPDEVSGLDVSISVLGPATPIDVDSEAALLRVLRPGVDGLVLQDGARRGVFLPAVWRELPDAREFLAALRRKAGLPPGHWSPTTRVERFEVRELGK